MPLVGTGVGSGKKKNRAREGRKRTSFFKVFAVNVRRWRALAFPREKAEEQQAILLPVTEGRAGGRKSVSGDQLLQ